MSNTNKSNAPVPSYARFTIAGLSGMAATLFVQPLDLVKIRMQLSGEGGKARDYSTSLDAVKTIVRKEGVFGLYSGLSANLFRQATYTTTRMGIYQATLDHLQKSDHQGLSTQIGAGMVGGFCAAFVATPSDVALVRMTANGRLPPAERRNYKNIFDALVRIATEEGRKGIFAGLGATIMRAMVANVAQLVSYTQAKQYLLRYGYMEDNLKCHFTSSLISGLVYALSTCPLDVAKTRMQYMKTETGTPMYSNILDALSKTVLKEGVPALWKGFFPLYIRCAPHTVLLFIFSEQLTSLYQTLFTKSSES